MYKQAPTTSQKRHNTTSSEDPVIQKPPNALTGTIRFTNSKLLISNDGSHTLRINHTKIPSGRKLRAAPVIRNSYVYNSSFDNPVRPVPPQTKENQFINLIMMLRG